MTQWLKIKLIDKPYYDRHGNILQSIAGRRNRKGRDEFSGGGKVYPVPPGKILERHERDGVWLIQVDASPEEAAHSAAEDKAMTYQASAKVVTAYNNKDFKIELLDETTAFEWKDEHKIKAQRAPHL